MFMPYVQGKKDGQTDIVSRLLEDRIILLMDDIDDLSAQMTITQLLYLDSINHEDITLYINSGGGICTSGLAIVDTMNLIQSDVKTIVIGSACSMGTIIASQGAKGKRYMTANSEYMIHQPLGGAYGQATDIKIQAENILKMKEKLIKMLAEASGQKFEKVWEDCERDHWMNAEETLEYGFIDRILK